MESIAGGMMFFSPYFFSSLVLLAFFPFLVWGKRRQRTSEKSPLVWRDLANQLFDHSEQSSPAEKLRVSLVTGCRVLGFENAILCRHQGGESEILEIFSQSSPLKKGEKIASESIYCGTLGKDRSSLSIEVAQLSEWRNHPAYKIMGWESYLGKSKVADSGEVLTLGFFQTRAREREISASDLEFMNNFSRWILSLAERADFSWEPMVNEKSSRSERDISV